MAATTMGCSDQGTPVEDGHASVPVWELSSEPVLAVGASLDADLMFSEVAAVAALPSGDMLVANRRNPPSVTRLDSTGQAEWVFGRSGEGPGEFRMIMALYVKSPDTIIVYDPMLARITHVSPTGELLQTTSIEHYPDARGAQAVAYQGVLSDGSFIAFHNYTAERSEVVGGRYLLPLLKIAADGSVIADSLALVPGPDVAEGSRRPLFARFPVVLSDQNRLVIGGDEGFRVWAIDLTSGDTTTFERQGAVRASNAAMIAALKEAELARVRDGPEADAWRGQIESRYEAPVYRDTLPVIQRILSRLPSELWVQHYLAPTDISAVWSVFDGRGVLTAEVKVPRSFTVMDVTENLVLGVWRDEFDVESVRVYPRGW